MNSTKQTVASYMDRIAAQYGLEAIETKSTSARSDLEPVTEEQLRLLSDAVFEQWIDRAFQCPEEVPDEIDLDQFTDHDRQKLHDTGEGHQPDGGGEQ
ncbi:hypothetical protein HYG81_18705 [Natrinema zhouii]|nr:hypothetical protein [Natrinema zhouii]UHQ97967.1 hypothetical protein HYG81_18705 [Natrinema zhouii]